MQQQILIVEDHDETRAMLTAALLEAGYLVHCTTTVAAAREYLCRKLPSLVILDLLLPDGHGLAICRKLRDTARLAKVPVIALTGEASLEDKAKGFRNGVDQYLTKPIVMAEFVMWVKALLRRVDVDKSGGEFFNIGELQMQLNSYVVKFRGRVVGNLTRREFELLYALAKNSPRIFSRREIITRVWRTESVDNLVDTHLYNLRSKLPPPLAANIQAVAGKGFRYLDNS